MGGTVAEGQPGAMRNIANRVLTQELSLMVETASRRALPCTRIQQGA